VEREGAGPRSPRIGYGCRDGTGHGGAGVQSAAGTAVAGSDPTTMCGRVADRAVQMHGGAGCMSEYPIERCFRDARVFRIDEGTSRIRQPVIARDMIRAAAR